MDISDKYFLKKIALFAGANDVNGMVSVFVSAIKCYDQLYINYVKNGIFFCYIYLLIPYEFFKKHLNTLLLFKYHTIELCLGCGDQNIRQGSREQKTVQIFFLNIENIDTTLVWKSLPS